MGEGKDKVGGRMRRGGRARGEGESEEEEEKRRNRRK